MVFWPLIYVKTTFFIICVDSYRVFNPQKIVIFSYEPVQLALSRSLLMYKRQPIIDNITPNETVCQHFWKRTMRIESLL